MRVNVKMNNNQFSTSNYQNDTIAAISTPLGVGGIGIVRMSGPCSISIASKVFRHKGKIKKKPGEFSTHRLYYGTIVYPENENLADEVILSVMRKPKTYTKEDIVEINCHGGLLVVNKVLEILIKNGARLAEPGEFTKLAFLNGRIDLSQAEAIIDIIQSNNDRTLNSSLYHLSGGLKERITNLINTIVNLKVKIEAPMDFPDQGIQEIDRKEIKGTLIKCNAEVKYLLDTFKYGQIIREGIRCIILGKTNVGKSSLFNSLLKKNRAIVAPMEGTTRDIIEENINLNGYQFNLVDTAGMKDPVNIVEQISLKKVNQSMGYAQILIVMFDTSNPLEQQDMVLINKINSFANRNKIIIVVENKTDLDTKMDLKLLYEKIGIKESIKMSVKKKKGIELLEKKMINIITSNVTIPEDGVVISRKRHQECLIKVQEILKNLLSSLDVGIQDDFIAIDLKYIINQLGRITGEVNDEEILNQVFSKFCIGK